METEISKLLKEKPPLALMESTFTTSDKIGNIFTKESDGTFTSPALEKIK